MGYANPIPRALAHYEREVIETATRSGLMLTRQRYPAIEDTRGPLNRLKVLLDVARAPRRLSSPKNATLLLWPTLGLLEPRLWKRSAGRAMIVFHDPEPLRAQVGFDRLSLRIARGLSSGGPLILSHSDEATSVLAGLFPHNEISQIAHPVMTRQVTHRKTPGLVVVAGQYKPVRDVELLAQLGPQLRNQGYDPLIVGSGWPHINGWRRDDRFVPEDELDSLLGAANVVLLPYRKYFQSGISIRALEQGTLTVGPRTSFAESMFGVESPLILEPGSGSDAWVEAIVSVPSVSAETAFERYVQHCDVTWKHAFDSIALTS